VHQWLYRIRSARPMKSTPGDQSRFSKVQFAKVSVISTISIIIFPPPPPPCQARTPFLFVDLSDESKEEQVGADCVRIGGR